FGGCDNVPHRSLTLAGGFMRNRMLTLVVLAGALVAGHQTTGAPRIDQTQAGVAKPVQYVVYYWRAKPGPPAAYNDYIRPAAAPIDENARSAGVFDEVHTYLSGTDAAGDWTHIRIFRLRSGGTPESLSAGLDAASKRMHPDEPERARNAARAAELRDFVRSEVWKELPVESVPRTRPVTSK